MASSLWCPESWPFKGEAQSHSAQPRPEGSAVLLALETCCLHSCCRPAHLLDQRVWRGEHGLAAREYGIA